MRQFLLLTALFIFSGITASFAQQDAAWKYATSITEEKLKDVLSVVASAQMEGRETGTEGQRRAAIYIQNQFEKIGLKAPASLDGYQQKYLLYRDSVVKTDVQVNGKKLLAGTDYILLTGDAISNTIKSNQIVFAGFGIDDKNYSDYKGKNVKGKIVVVLNGEPKKDGKYLVSGTEKSSVWTYSVNRKAEAAARHGALAVIFTDPSMEKFPSYMLNMNSRSNFFFPRAESGGGRPSVVYALPSVLDLLFKESDVNEIRAVADNKIAAESIKVSSKKDVEISYAKKRFSVLASNIIGYVEGSDLKDEYVFLTAHYDHLGMHDGKIYYGADDDGSGTTAVIEMAAAFQKAKNEGNGPRRTVVFMTVSGEEKGLWGSEYYSEHPVFPLDKTTVDLNTDMIGRIDPNRNYGDSTNYVYVIGNDKLSSDLDPISKNVNEKYTHLELDYKFNDPKDPERIYYRSDHYNFAKKGVPIIFYFDGIHKDYHKPSDTVDKINFDLMLKRTRYIFLTAWDMANRDQMLKRDIPLPEMSR